MDFLTNTTHLHITTWVVAVILFAVAAFASKPMKGVHMALRAMYIFVIISGGLLFMEHRSVIADAAGGSGMSYDMKVLFGVLVIGFMEMVLVRKAKGKSINVVAILFAITLLVTIYLGLSMGIGFNLF